MMRTMEKRNKMFRRWGAILLLVPLLSGCSLASTSKKEGAESIDPPQSAIEQTLTQGDGSLSNSSQDIVTVYLLDRNGYLAPMSLRLDSEQTSSQSSSQSSPAEKAIAWMTAKKQLTDQLPRGFSAILPEGTKVSSVEIDKSAETISVDFAAPFPNLVASQERKVIEALVWTLTELPGINKVKLSIAGKPIQSLPSSGLPVDHVLTRGVGINVEAAKGIEINRSMAVTLYFSAHSTDGDGYFVPVTRLITRQADPAKAALEQLIQGPQNTKALNPVLTSDMTIEKLSQMADTVNVSLNDAGWMPKSPIPSEMMEALVLTLTEVTGAPQVRVVMNGDDSLVDSDQRSYASPVTRPTNVNTLSR
ncbi:GerMN domain-containing protein [Cohnella abietis]|uniref:Sporulation protein n=1 Tax=Cohnella abietis TaxID=2507935 RepID=A0A3T1D2X0_9BACL|nr:GerMN domain-containing protein [Cohnella abietis]BBI32434.1 sporulation protein [Cohnella abietis]